MVASGSSKISMAVTVSCSTLADFTAWVLVQAVINNKHRLNNEKPVHVLVRHFEWIRFLFIVFPYHRKRFFRFLVPNCCVEIRKRKKPRPPISGGGSG
jgi:hypothetical protein